VTLSEASAWPIILIRATRAELRKLRNTLAVLVVVVVPIAVLLMLGANIATRDPGARLPGADPWMALLDNFSLWLWGHLALPLLVALVTALLAHIEHTDNHWVRLFALPTPRWAIYAAKLITAMLLLSLSSLVLALGIGLTGLLLDALNPARGLHPPVPWGEIGSQVIAVDAASALLISLQAWLALRWQNFSVACGVGIGGTVVGLVATFSTRGSAGLLPWNMPVAVVPVPPNGTWSLPLLAVSVGAGLIVAALGCWDLVRRDVT
jgi:ABC-2 type transport system permease protein